MRVSLLQGTFLLLLALAGFLSACGSDSNPAALSTHAGATVAFKFAPEIAEEERRLVEQAVSESRGFFARELGRDLKLNITIEVTTDDQDFFLGFSYGRTAWLFTGNPLWPKDNDPSSVLTKEQLIAHELFHNFQWDLLTTDDSIPSNSPRWLIEGAAEYASERFIESRGGSDWDLDHVLPYRIATIGYDARIDSNVMLTSELYWKWFLAVNLLMEERPLSHLGDYFEATGRMDWRDAFVQTFGEEPETFVDRFESSGDAYR